MSDTINPSNKAVLNWTLDVYTLTRWEETYYLCCYCPNLRLDGSNPSQPLARSGNTKGGPAWALGKAVDQSRSLRLYVSHELIPGDSASAKIRLVTVLRVPQLPRLRDLAGNFSEQNEDVTDRGASSGKLIALLERKTLFFLLGPYG